MPTSGHWQIPHVLDVIAVERPATILDVGAGHGQYGCLARELETTSRVDAIDVNAPRHPVYDHFYLGNVGALDRVLPSDVPRYDLALFIDVIEHLEKPEAHRVLGELTRRARRVLVTTPLGFRAQEIPGQPYETHRSGWYPWDFFRLYRVHRWKIYPGHFTRRLGLPRLWQLLALVSAPT